MSRRAAIVILLGLRSVAFEYDRETPESGAGGPEDEIDW